MQWVRKKTTRTKVHTQNAGSLSVRLYLSRKILVIQAEWSTVPQRSARQCRNEVLDDAATECSTVPQRSARQCR